MWTMIPIFKTQLGALFETDCMNLLETIDGETIDLAFADPPFNLGKEYSSGIDDAKSGEDYLAWSYQWLEQMIRVLKPGGSLFLWNLPKWNLSLGAFLAERLTFRNWITVDIKYSLPINGRLYPSHYSLLYFIKGERPSVFHPDRLPVPCCKQCGGELRDYGGYKSKMNPLGVNLSDVWTDIPPVRHAKYKKRDANALPLKLMDRIISMSSDPGNLILDPFGGSGTTFIASELTGRKWIGSELECASILTRFSAIEDDLQHLKHIHSHKNTLFTKEIILKRIRMGNPLSKHYRLDSTSGIGVADSQAEPQEELFSVRERALRELDHRSLSASKGNLDRS